MRKGKLEKAAALELPDIRKAPPRFLREQDCVYVGSEFCQNLFPSAADVGLLLDKGARRVAVMTSFMVTEGLRRAEKALSPVLEKFGGVEVVVNDPGLLLYLEKFHPEVPRSMGRLLSRDFMRADPAGRKEFFRKHRLSAMETDEADMIRNLGPAPGFRVHLHYPLKYAAMSRACPFVRRTTLNCGRKCQGRALRLPVPDSRREIFAVANAYFFEYAPGAPAGVSRLVRHLWGERGDGGRSWGG